MLGADTIVQIAGKYTFPDNISFLSLHTFIVKVHRTAIERNRAVIYHIDMFVAYFLVQAGWRIWICPYG